VSIEKEIATKKFENRLPRVFQDPYSDQSLDTDLQDSSWGTDVLYHWEDFHGWSLWPKTKFRFYVKKYLNTLKL